MRKAYIAEVIVDQSIKLVAMFLQNTDRKSVEKTLTSRYSSAKKVELKALIPDIAIVRPTIQPMAFA